MKQDWRTYALGAVLLLGLLARWHDLGAESFWLDEGISVRAAKLPVGEMLAERARNHHPPLYFLLLKSWTAVFGYSETAVRSLSVVFGWLLLPALWLVGRRVFGPDAALFAVTLAAASRLQIYYSQEARSYAMLLFLALASTRFFLRLLDEPGRRAALWYLASAYAMLLTHYSSLFVIAAHNLAFAGLLPRMRQRGRDLGRWLGLQGALALAFLPWVFLGLRSMRAIARGFWIPEPTAAGVASTFREYAGSWPLAAAFAALALLALLLRERDRRETEGLWVAAALLAVPVLAPLLVSWAWAPVYWTRYTLPASLGLVLLAARGLARLRPALLGRTLVLAMALLSLAGVLGYYRLPSRDQWREAAALLEERARPGDLVLVSPGYTLEAVYLVYARRTDLELATFPKWTGRVDEGSISGLRQALRGRTRFWLVRSAHLDDPRRLVEARLRRHWSLVSSDRLFRIEVRLYERKKIRPPIAPDRKKLLTNEIMDEKYRRKVSPRRRERSVAGER